MSDHAQTRFWSGIDVPKMLAGTLAAVSAAVVGSFLGVAGTLIGAAVASVISSIGTEVYHRSINRGAKTLQSAFVTAPAAVGTPDVAATHEPPSEVPEVPEDTEKKRLHWKRISLVAAALFVIALGSLTAVELMAGKTAADAVSGRDGGSPTLLNFSDKSDNEEETPATEQSAPATEAPQDGDTDATTGPSTAPETAEPTATAPAGEPTGEPAPTPATGGDTGGDTGEEPPAGDKSGQDEGGTQELQQEGTDSGR
ncbi:hypothetical protein [Actinoplanes sp. GCM10030250]|uniref:hypothetical protein n=1 Tax=Actinoplanes sp. GCM10030250 TaxID=3273376 RepID=UPI003615ECA7